MACNNQPFSNNSLKQLDIKFLIDLVDSPEEISFFLTYFLKKIVIETDKLKIVREFRQVGGLEILLNLLNRFSNSNNSEWIGTAINILYLCCNDESNCTLIANQQTISLLITILKSTNNCDLIRNICGLFVRLPYDQVYSKNGDSIIEILVHLVVSNNDSNCEKQVTALLIDLLDDDQSNIPEDIVNHLLRYYNPQDTDASVKILTTLAKIKNNIWSERMTECVITVIGIGNLFAYAENGDDKLQRASLKIMGSMAYARFFIFYDFIELGIISIYMKQVRELLNTGCDDEYGILDDLETYCEDEVSRKLICDNGLETLLLLLNRWDNKYIIDRLLDSFSFLIVEEWSREKLLSLGLVSVLISKLSECLKENTHQLKTDWKIEAILGTLWEVSISDSEDNMISPYINSSVLETLLEAISYDLGTILTTTLMRIIFNFMHNCLSRFIIFLFPHLVSSILNNNYLLHSASNVDFYKKNILDEFKEIIESSYGMEVIDQLLTAGDQSEKESAAFMLSYILRPTARKYPQFLNIYHKSLNLILQILHDFNENNNILSCFLCLSQIFKWHLKLTNNSLLEQDSCAFNSELDKDVCFVLDDGQRVFAKRQKVSESSDMFNAMLNSGFIEAKQSEISFGFASRDVFELIMHLLHGCYMCSCPQLRNADIQLLFDTANMADRLVLMEEKDNVLKAVVKKSTCYNIVSLCEYAVRHNFTTFLSLVLDHVMGNIFNPVDRIQILCLILNSKLRNELLQEIRKKIIPLFYT